MNINTPRRVLARILESDISTGDLRFFLASSVGEDESPVLQRVNIGLELVETFRLVATQSFQGLASALSDGDVNLRAFSPQTKLDPHEIEYLKLDEHDAVLDQVALLAAWQRCDLFNRNPRFVRHLRFYATSIEPEVGRTIHFVRAYSQRKELSRSGMFAAIFQDGQYDRLRDGMLLFDERIDCFSQGSWMFILNKNGFNRIFRYYDLLAASARDILVRVAKQVPIQDFDDFAEACEAHVQKMSKLHNIASQPYFTRITVSDLRTVIERHHLPIEVVEADGAEKLVYDPADKWAILRLLDDGYLESHMTGSCYEVNSKRIVGN